MASAIIDSNDPIQDQLSAFDGQESPAFDADTVPLTTTTSFVFGIQAQVIPSEAYIKSVGGGGYYPQDPSITTWWARTTGFAYEPPTYPYILGRAAVINPPTGNGFTQVPSPLGNISGDAFLTGNGYVLGQATVGPLMIGDNVLPPLEYYAYGVFGVGGSMVFGSSNTASYQFQDTQFCQAGIWEMTFSGATPLNASGTISIAGVLATAFSSTGGFSAIAGTSNPFSGTANFVVPAGGGYMTATVAFALAPFPSPNSISFYVGFRFLHA